MAGKHERFLQTDPEATLGEVCRREVSSNVDL